MKYHFFIACALVVALAACSKPKSVIIPTDVATWDKNLAPEIQKLTLKEQKLLNGYLLRLKIGETFSAVGIPSGLTIGNAIEAQNIWLEQQQVQEAKENALKEKLAKERGTVELTLNSAVTLTLLEKKEIPRDGRGDKYRDLQVIKVGIKNTSEKEISGVAGTLEFIDIFDKKVGEINFSIAKTIRPNQEVTWWGSRDYEPYVPEQKAVWSLEKGKYKAVFNPSKLVYSDGTKISIPE